MSNLILAVANPYVIMSAMENDFIKITADDVAEANQLSLHCPICAGPVERFNEHRELAPVVCGACGTLYHSACWHNAGDKCAILGCSHTTCKPFESAESGITITMNDVPSSAEVTRTNKRLKAQERGRVAAEPQTQGFWQRLFQRIAEAFGG